MPGLFSQHLLLYPLAVAVCSRWMPDICENKHQDSFPNVYCYGVYENKHQDSFPNFYYYVPWQSQFFLNGCLVFMKINTRTLFPTATAMVFIENKLLLCPLTVAVFSQWMPGVYENKHQDSFPNGYCYGVYENKHQDSFPNIYCYVPWQSEVVLDGCLAFIFINAATLFPTCPAISLDSRSLFSMEDWHLFSKMPGLFPQCLLLCPLTVAVCSRWMPGFYENKQKEFFPCYFRLWK